jgi:hypothetical protein
MCVCMYVETARGMSYIYIYIYIYTHTHTHTHMCVCVYVSGSYVAVIESELGGVEPARGLSSLCVCMYICGCGCVCVCMWELCRCDRM